jgi:hypothetical protein
MANAKAKTQYREGTLGWFLMQAGWTPVERTDCLRGSKHLNDQSGKCSKCHEFAHPLWQFSDFGELLSGWEARRLELLQIHDAFKAKAKGVGR